MTTLIACAIVPLRQLLPLDGDPILAEYPNTLQLHRSNMDSWILEKIRAASLRRMVAWTLSLGVWVLAGIGASRYFTNFFFGPFALTGRELDSIENVDDAPRYFARVTGTRVLDTGIREYNSDNTATASYYALVVGDKYLIFKSSAAPTPVAEGELVPWASDLADMLRSSDMGEMRHHLYPFYVSDESFRLSGYFAIAFLLVYGFLFVRYAVPAWRHLRDPATHPLGIRMATWGDPVGVTFAVEREFRAPRYKNWRGWRAGEQYLVESRAFNFEVHRLQDLLHAYKKVTQHRYHFVIPMGKTYEARLFWEEGTAAISGSQKKVDEILRHLQQHVPWAVHGYNPAVETLYKKQRQELVAQVRQRRSQWEQGGGSQAR
jgi:hypothetical protein